MYSNSDVIFPFSISIVGTSKFVHSFDHEHMGNVHVLTVTLSQGFERQICFCFFFCCPYSNTEFSTLQIFVINSQEPIWLISLRIKWFENWLMLCCAAKRMGREKYYYYLWWPYLKWDLFLFTPTAINHITERKSSILLQYIAGALEIHVGI